jgi:hypothetical protein
MGWVYMLRDGVLRLGLDEGDRMAVFRGQARPMRRTGWSRGAKEEKTLVQVQDGRLSGVAGVAECEWVAARGGWVCGLGCWARRGGEEARLAAGAKDRQELMVGSGKTRSVSCEEVCLSAARGWSRRGEELSPVDSGVCMFLEAHG